MNLFAWSDLCGSAEVLPPEREFFIDNLLVRIHFIILMITPNPEPPTPNPQPPTPNLASLPASFLLKSTPLETGHFQIPDAYDTCSEIGPKLTDKKIWLAVYVEATVVRPSRISGGYFLDFGVFPW